MYTRGVQVKLWDPLRTRATLDRIRSRLPYLTSHISIHFETTAAKRECDRKPSYFFTLIRCRPSWFCCIIMWTSAHKQLIKAWFQGGAPGAPPYFRKAEDLKKIVSRPVSVVPLVPNWLATGLISVFRNCLFPRDLQVKECVCVGIWLFHDTALVEGQRIPTLNVFLHNLGLLFRR